MKTKSELFYEKRKRLVPNALGIFNPSTADNAHNAMIVNADGTELIDFAGGIGVINAGHCPEPVVKAIKDQSEKLLHSSFNVALYEVYLSLAEKLTHLLPHDKPEETKVMLVNTGAEAVENAIKIARQINKRSAVISYVGGFHGRSMMAMSLTSKVAYKVDCGPYAPETYKIEYPAYNSKDTTLTEEEFAQQHINALAYFFKSQIPAHQVAAIIVELVQGEGGFLVISKSYLQKLRQVCDENGIVLIFDEVQSGFGRTGYWGAMQHFGVTPDLSTWAKSMGSGMPIGAVIGKATLMDKINPGTIGGTYAGNPVCCAASLATLEYMEKININTLGKKVGHVVLSRFQEWQKKYPQIVGDIRGIGAMLAFDIIKGGNRKHLDGDTCKEIMNECAANGLIIISAGLYGAAIRILSPLTIEDATLSKGLDILENSLKARN